MMGLCDDIIDSPLYQTLKDDIFVAAQNRRTLKF